MKKVFAFFLAVILCWSLYACNSTNDTNSAETTELNDGRVELTLDNYEQYLEVWELKYVGGRGSGAQHSHELEVEVHTRGVSNNFNYYDVEIVADVVLTYTECFYSGGIWYRHEGEETQTCEVTINKVNVAGEGEVVKIFSQEDYFSNASSGSNVTIDVKSVSGYVAPAK